MYAIDFQISHDARHIKPVTRYTVSMVYNNKRYYSTYYIKGCENARVISLKRFSFLVYIPNRKNNIFIIMIIEFYSLSIVIYDQFINKCNISRIIIIILQKKD